MTTITEALNELKTTEQDMFELELELYRREHFTSTQKVKAFCWDDLIGCYMLVWDDIMIPQPL